MKDQIPGWTRLKDQAKQGSVVPPPVWLPELTLHLAQPQSQHSSPIQRGPTFDYEDTVAERAGRTKHHLFVKWRRGAFRKWRLLLAQGILWERSPLYSFQLFLYIKRKGELSSGWIENGYLNHRCIGIMNLPSPHPLQEYPTRKSRITGWPEI